MAATMSAAKYVVLVLVSVISLCKGEYTPVKIDFKADKDGKPLRVFTAEDIAKYDASDPDLPIYMGIRGVVFDVTSGKHLNVRRTLILALSRLRKQVYLTFANSEDPDQRAPEGAFLSEFYGKASPYNKMVGKDASRGHAVWSLDEKDLTHDLTGLSDDQLKGLDEIFTGTYMAKYKVVGYMDFLVDQQPEEVAKKLRNNDEL